MAYRHVRTLQEGPRRMTVYPIGVSGQRLLFTAPALEHLRRYRQLRWWSREAGGQLFARFAMPDIIIEKATGPRRSDWRTRYSFRPNRRAEQREIGLQHAQDLHFVGDWHTHPERIPQPSQQDELSVHEMFSRSSHALNGFILVIVGQDDFPAGLFVSIVDGSTIVPLITGRYSPDQLNTAA
jgi:integrative and conjugative element protein (TIGR02256 family)